LAVVAIVGNCVFQTVFDTAVWPRDTQSLLSKPPSKPLHPQKVVGGSPDAEGFRRQTGRPGEGRTEAQYVSPRRVAQGRPARLLRDWRGRPASVRRSRIGGALAHRRCLTRVAP